MAPRNDLILFVDLETTGTDEERDNIIEVGLSLLDATKDEYPEIASYSAVVLPSELGYERMLAKDVVREMHEANGLLSQVNSMRHLMIYDQEIFLPPAIDLSIIKWLRLYDDGKTDHIPLGGSGVQHFDRRFTKKYLPKLDARLTHWAYDVGVLRRSFQKAGVAYASMDAKTHRALDDARVHAEEWRWYQKFIKGEL